MTDNDIDDDSYDVHAAFAAAGDDIEYMFAQTSGGISIADGRITLNNVSAATLFFSDRPERLTGHVTTDEFVDSWGAGDNSFAADPPNAVLSIFEEETVNDVVVVLSDPVLSNGDLSYAVEVTDGELAASAGPVSLFIDMIGRPLTPVSVAGVRRRGRRRGRRRTRRRMR